MTFQKDRIFEAVFTMMRNSEVRATSIWNAWCYLLCLIIQLLVGDKIYNLGFPTIGLWILKSSPKREPRMHDIHKYQVQTQ